MWCDFFDERSEAVPGARQVFSASSYEHEWSRAKRGTRQEVACCGKGIASAL